MSIETNNGNKLFNCHLPDDAVRRCFEFLKEERGALALSRNDEDKVILATASVCKEWQNNPVLQEERREAATRIRQWQNLKALNGELIERNYPADIVQLFRNAGLPIGQLPVLDLPDHLFTFPMHQIRLNQMRHKAMRFIDNGKRPGIALCVRANANEFTSRDGRKFPLGVQQKVLVIHQRYTYDANSWIHAWGGDDDRWERIFMELHKESARINSVYHFCPTCPFKNKMIGNEALSNLLNEQNPVFRLATPQQETNRSSRTVFLEAAVVAVVLAYLANRYLPVENKFKDTSVL